MRKLHTIMAAVAVASAMSAAPAVAEDWHHGGGWHAGGWHGHDWDGWHGGVGLGFGFDGAFPFAGPYAYYDPYVAPPPAVTAPAWYCPASNAYYPTVPTCPVPWQQVPMP